MANWVILRKDNFVSLVLANNFSLCALQFSHEPILLYMFLLLRGNYTAKVICAVCAETIRRYNNFPPCVTIRMVVVTCIFTKNIPAS